MLPDGIRNYMSKPWFLSMTMESDATPLAAQINRILEPTSSELCQRNGTAVAHDIGQKMKAGM
jgi:cystathionine beta-synthase